MRVAYDGRVTEVAIYRGGNAWQNDRYAFMSDYLWRRGVRRFGRSRGGTAYRHLLVEDDAIENFLGDPRILDAVRHRFSSHKAGDLERALTNTTASTPFCFNLFVPLQLDRELASAVTSAWLGRPFEVAHLEIEFTPNLCEVEGFEARGDESLGDQSGPSGTDADVAVFYRDGRSRGVILIETKYIEDGFSRCRSYEKKPHVRPFCDAGGYHARLIAPHVARAPARPDCGYLRYSNWTLTSTSRLFEHDAVTDAPGCPFRGSPQQIWRNLLLAERVAAARGLDELHFWVLSPVENSFLWIDEQIDVEQSVRALLSRTGNSAFRRLELLRDFVKPLRQRVRGGSQQAWLDRLVERYVPSADP